MSDYPSVMELDCIRAKIVTYSTFDPRALRSVFALVEEAWNHDYGRMTVTPKPKPKPKPGIIEYELATGGWSGNEDLIVAMSDNHPFWSAAWVRSESGGLHVFRIDDQ